MPKLVMAMLLAVAVVSPAAAQTSIRGVELSSTDAARVQRQCDVLKFKEMQSLAADTPEPPDPGVILSDPAAYWADGADGMDASLARVNLNTLSLRDCREAGFY